jgi:hypothetical protein
MSSYALVFLLVDKRPAASDVPTVSRISTRPQSKAYMYMVADLYTSRILILSTNLHD